MSRDARGGGRLGKGEVGKNPSKIRDKNLGICVLGGGSVSLVEAYIGL